MLRARFHALWQYRTAALAGTVTNVFWALLKIMVLEAFYDGARAAPLSFAQAVSYVWLGQAVFTMLPWNVDPEARLLVKTGGLAYELIRPVDVYAMWLARALAFRSAPTSLRAGAVLVAGAVVMPYVQPSWALLPPASLGAGLAWVALMCGALVLSSAMTTLMHAALPASGGGEGVERFGPSMVLLFSGMLVPLPLLPEWVQPILRATPFRWLLDMPLRAYTGAVAIADALSGCVEQLAWTVGLIVAGRWLLGRGLRDAELAGG